MVAALTGCNSDNDTTEPISEIILEDILEPVLLNGSFEKDDDGDGIADGWSVSTTGTEGSVSLVESPVKDGS